MKTVLLLCERCGIEWATNKHTCDNCRRIRAKQRNDRVRRVLGIVDRRTPEQAASDLVKEVEEELKTIFPRKEQP